MELGKNTGTVLVTTPDWDATCPAQSVFKHASISRTYDGVIA